MPYNEKGEEVLDPTPVNVPINWSRPVPLAERIRQMIRNEASLIAQAQGAESFEEADDFDVEDDTIDPRSPWEENFDPDVPFIASREAEIKSGAVNDFDEARIHKGKEELERLEKQRAEKSRPSKAKAKPAPDADDEVDEA